MLIPTNAPFKLHQSRNRFHLCQNEGVDGRRGHDFLINPQTSSVFAIGSLIAAFRQSARDHLRLDLGCAFENIENARIAKNAADLIFERITIATVNLQAGVGI